jgi:mannose-6-phosphate isomerase-like protein (cupin superfamily)
MELVHKLWGLERWLHNNKDYCVKILELQPGVQSSLHYHKVKGETFVVVSGKVKLEVLQHFTTSDVTPHIKTMYLKPFQHHTLAPWTPHRFTAVDGPATIVEASSFHDDEDVFRLEDSRAI